MFNVGAFNTTFVIVPVVAKFTISDELILSFGLLNKVKFSRTEVAFKLSSQLVIQSPDIVEAKVETFPFP